MALSRHPQRRALQLQQQAPDAEVKSAEFSQQVIQSLSLLGGGYYCGTYGAMYRRQPAVRAVVDFLAKNVAQLNGKVYERISDTDRLEVNSHPLATLLRNPNPRTTRYAHMFSTVADMAIYDRAYWLIMRSGRRIAVKRLSPAQLSIETDERGNRTYRLLDGTEILRSRLVVFPGYSPDTDAEGVSPLETLRQRLQSEFSSEVHREAQQLNAVRASGIIRRPLEAPAWSDAARARFRADLDLLLAGAANAGKVALLEDGMTWETPSFDPHYDEYVSLRELTHQEVAIVYFGPVVGRAWSSSATASGSQETHRQLYQDVLAPLLRQLQDEIELQLLPEVQPIGREGTYFEFNLADKLKGSFEEQARIITTATGVPTVSVNEGRARMNLPKLEGDEFDLPVMPMNVVYGGQPAETIPTADPSTPAPPPLMSAPPTGLKDALVRFFDRQAVALMSPKARIGGRERWDRELAADLEPFVGTDSADLASVLNAETFKFLDDIEQTPESVRAMFEMTKNVRADRIAAIYATA
jgi:HK97 family phage portal protein